LLYWYVQLKIKIPQEYGDTTKYDITAQGNKVYNTVTQEARIRHVNVVVVRSKILGFYSGNQDSVSVLVEAGIVSYLPPGSHEHVSSMDGNIVPQAMPKQQPVKQSLQTHP
jgi:hypothetical protein